MKIKADLLIFDLDGTLMNSIPDLTAALNFTSKTFRLSMFEENEVKKLVGGGIRKLISDAFGIDRDKKEYDDYYSCFMGYYADHHSVNSHLFEGVIEILEFYKNKKLAILSNKFDHFTKQMAIDYKIDEYFDIVLGANDKMEKKPSAEPIEYIINYTGITRDLAVMIGDSEQDILTAKNAGIKSIALTYGYRTKEQLLSMNPDFICDNILEIKDIIE